MSDTAKPRLLVLAYSPTARDARVLRQVRFYAPHFRVTVAGFGENPFTGPDAPDVEWFEMDRKGSYFSFPDFRLRVFAQMARFCKWGVNAYAQSIPWMRYGFHLAQSRRFRLIHCNDVDALPAGIAALKTNRSCKLILDLHEYPTREAEGGAHWVWERKPFVTGTLKHFARYAHGTVTVADSFVEPMTKEFRMKRPIVVRNAPELVALPPHPPADGKIHLIHHGAAIRTRKTELMIEMMKSLDARFVLHFMLTGDADYITELRRIAESEAPGRVVFENAVKPGEIAAAISRFDIGVYILPPITFNDLHAMPNKFFDFMGAGLAIAIAPSVNMARITKENGIGWVAEDFTPATMARMLNSVGDDDIAAKRAASLKLRETFNAATEMGRLVELAMKVTGGK